MKYNTIYAFGKNNESGIRSRQVPVWGGLFSIVLCVVNSGPNYYYGIDFSIIDIYFDKYCRQNDFEMQYCHSTILQCDPQVAGHNQSTIDHACHVPIM